MNLSLNSKNKLKSNLITFNNKTKLNTEQKSKKNINAKKQKIIKKVKKTKKNVKN